MLIWMRERKSQLVKWFVWPLIFVFIALYGSAQIQNQIAIDKLTVLKVNGTRIPQRDYQAAVEEIGRRLQDSLVRPEKSQSRLALEQLVQNELARQLAEELRLRTDDSKLRQSLSYYLTGGRGGPINEQGLLRFIREQGFETLDQFREHMRGQMGVGLAMDYVASTAAPSEKDLQRALQRQRETRTVEALLFEIEPHREQVRATTEEVQAYFQKNIERYRFPKRMKIDYVEEKPEEYVQSATFTEENLTRWFNSNKEKFLVPVERDVAALTFSAKDFRERVTLADTEVQAAFEADQTQYTDPEKFRIRFLTAPVEPPDASIEAEIAKSPDDFIAKEDAVAARHLLLRVPQDASARESEDIRAKIEAIRSRIHAEEDFIREVREYSDDPSNKHEGGDLGYFDKSRMVSEFADAAFSISPATVTAPIKTSFGYHLIWVYAKRPAGERLSLREARIVLTGKIDDAPFKEAARRKLEGIRTALAGKSLSAATAVTDLPVYESDLFARGDSPHPEAARDRYAFAPACAKMTVGGSPEIVEAYFKYYLIELIERQEQRPKTFDEARPEVEKTLRNRKALELARTQARNAAALVRSGSLEFAAIPKAYGIPDPVTHTDLREPSTQAPQLPKNQAVPREILNVAFKLKEGQLEGPIESMEGSSLARLIGEEPEHLPEISEVAEAAREEYRRVVAANQAEDRVWNVWTSLDTHEKSLRKAGEAAGVPVGNSEYFEPGALVPGFPENSVIHYAAAGLRVVGATSPSVLEDPPKNPQNPQPVRAYSLVQAVAIEETRLPEFAEVAEQARRDLELERAAPIVEASAEAALQQVAALIAAATQPLSASKSLELAPFAREHGYRFVGPISVRLDPQVSMLPGQNSGASFATTAYQLPLGGVSKVVPIEEPVRQGDQAVQRPLAFAILQVVDTQKTTGGVFSRSQAFNVLRESIGDAVQSDWAQRGRKQARIKINADLVGEEDALELTKEQAKS